MASSYRNMAEALTPHMNAVAATVGDLVGVELAVHVMPNPTMGSHTVWLELPAPSQKDGKGLDGLDETTVAVHVAVSVPYDAQRDNPYLAYDIADLLNVEFPDEMLHEPDLRHTRAQTIQPLREQWGPDGGPTQLTVRIRLDVPVFTRPV